MMPKGRGRKGGIPEINIETHPYNERILPTLRVPLHDLHFVRDNMPAPDVLNAQVHGWTHVLHMLVYASAFCQYADFDQAVVRWAILLHDAGRYSDDQEESKHGLMGAYVFSNMCKKADEAGAPVAVDQKQVIGIVERHTKTDEALSTEEAVVRACDRLDLWRLPGFTGLKPELMEAPGWQRVRNMARYMRLEGRLWRN